MVQLRNVSKIYGEGSSAVHALDRVDLDIYPGEVLVLMGPSGSGKTTLLSIIGCILKPTSGSVKVNGHEVAALPERRMPAIRLRNFGFIFQGFNLFPALTARENVELILKLKGAGAKLARKQAQELLTRVGLELKLNTVPADLSGGQKQRVAIARALAGAPPVLLADEPTAALDSATGISVMDMLADRVRESGSSVVVVTHDDRLLRYADRVATMRDGRIESSVSREEQPA